MASTSRQATGTSETRAAASAGSGGTFCHWVKRWRSYLGVTQRRFAELWGVSPSMVQKIETDDYSVSQLSFERLEALRALLKLPSATFYSLIVTRADASAEIALEPTHETIPAHVEVQRLEPGLPPLTLPQTLLRDVLATQLIAFTISPLDFAPDRLRYSLRVGSLLIFDPVRNPQTGDVRVSLAQHDGQKCRVLLPCSSETPIFLRPFASESDAMLEPEVGDLEPLGVVVAGWLTFPV